MLTTGFAKNDATQITNCANVCIPLTVYKSCLTARIVYKSYFTPLIVYKSLQLGQFTKAVFTARTVYKSYLTPLTVYKSCRTALTVNKS